jgi:hypothetical protein
VQPKLEIRAVYSPYDCCLNVFSESHSDVMSGGIAECDSITVLLYKECHFVSLGSNITLLSHFFIMLVRHCVITVSGRHTVLSTSFETSETCRFSQ